MRRGWEKKQRTIACFPGFVAFAAWPSGFGACAWQVEAGLPCALAGALCAGRWPEGRDARQLHHLGRAPELSSAVKSRACRSAFGAKEQSTAIQTCFDVNGDGGVSPSMLHCVAIMYYYIAMPTTCCSILLLYSSILHTSIYWQPAGSCSEILVTCVVVVVSFADSFLLLLGLSSRSPLCLRECIVALYPRVPSCRLRPIEPGNFSP